MEIGLNILLDAIKEQHTTRRTDFSHRPVDPQLIEAMKSAILKTPNASNRQSYSIIDLDHGKAKSLGFPGQRVFLFCVDFYRLHLMADQLIEDFDSSYLLQFSTALIDISMLAQSAVLAAQSLKLATLVTNEVYHKKIEKIFKELEIPEAYVFPMLALCLGYSDKKPEPHGRLDSSIIFHRNKYRKPEQSTIMEIIQGYNQKDLHLALMRQWESKGYQNYLNWFFKGWSKKVGSRKQNVLYQQWLEKCRMI